MILSRIILFPYWLALRIRNARYDSGRRQAVQHDVPVISVGNLTVGGTGKTPMVEYLVNRLKEEHRVAVLSRGYKRRSKGFHLVEADDTATTAGDEPLQIKRKFPDILVAVDKDRNHGVEQLLALPEAQRPEVILLDDGFQFRKLKPSTNLLLVDYNRPVFDDELLPFGRLRDLPEQIRRADAVIVTKTPTLLDEYERGQMRRKLHLRPEQPLFFTSIQYDAPKPVFPEQADMRYLYSKEVLLFTGVADDRPLLVQLSDRYERIDHKRYGDHHRFSRRDLKDLARYVRRNPRTLLMTTEKDAMRLLHADRLDAEVRRRLFCLPIEPAFPGWEETREFDALIRGVLPK